MDGMYERYVCGDDIGYLQTLAAGSDLAEAQEKMATLRRTGVRSKQAHCRHPADQLTE